MSTAPAIDKTAIRHAATIMLVRDHADGPQVLMGQRGASAAFMPDKFVFPGGAVDPDDAQVPLGTDLSPLCTARLEAEGGMRAATLAAAAIRELWEETGLMLGTPGVWPGPPHPDWAQFAARGMLPAADALTFVFRAITPPGRPRRFDARFFLADATRVQGDPTDFSAACEELSHLQWVPFSTARHLNLPFITEVVLAEAEACLRDGGKPDSVPFFDNAQERSEFRRIA
ncbi:NUDIX hydrolase [Rhabdonatronobacter sediminivivens]